MRTHVLDNAGSTLVSRFAGIRFNNGKTLGRESQRHAILSRFR